jgi:hypothetical protein
MFERIAAFAASAVVIAPPGPSSSETGSVEAAAETADTESAMSADASDRDSSAWESQESLETGMEVDTAMDVEILPPDVDTRGSYFATS